MKTVGLPILPRYLSSGVGGELGARALVLEGQERRPQQILVRIVGRHPASGLLPAAAPCRGRYNRKGFPDARYGSTLVAKVQSCIRGNAVRAGNQARPLWRERDDW
jgi:hypothetical protein